MIEQRDYYLIVRIIKFIEEVENVNVHIRVDFKQNLITFLLIYSLNLNRFYNSTTVYNDLYNLILNILY